MGTRIQAKNTTEIPVWAAAHHGEGRGEPVKAVI